MSLGSEALGRNATSNNRTEKGAGMSTQGVLGAATLKEFEDGLHGELIRPGDSAYDGLAQRSAKA